MQAEKQQLCSFRCLCVFTASCVLITKRRRDRRWCRKEEGSAAILACVFRKWENVGFYFFFFNASFCAPIRLYSTLSLEDGEDIAVHENKNIIREIWKPLCEKATIYRLKMGQMPVGTIVIIEKHWKVDARKKNNANRVDCNTSAYGFPSILIMNHTKCAKHLLVFHRQRLETGCHNKISFGNSWLCLCCAQKVFGACYKWEPKNNSSSDGDRCFLSFALALRADKEL